jgi:hypothetical protein
MYTMVNLSVARILVEWNPIAVEALVAAAALVVVAGAKACILLSAFFLRFSAVSSLICEVISSIGLGHISSQKCLGTKGRNFLYNSTCLMGRKTGGISVSSMKALISSVHALPST